MSKQIEIATGNYKFRATLNSSGTARKLAEILPVTSAVNTWGDEIYFSIPLRAEPEDGKEVLEIGDIAFWPPGNAFCIFFGKTPASVNSEPRAASPVTVLGRIENTDINALRSVKSGETIVISEVH